MGAIWKVSPMLSRGSRSVERFVCWRMIVRRPQLSPGWSRMCRGSVSILTVRSPALLGTVGTCTFAAPLGAGVGGGGGVLWIICSASSTSGCSMRRSASSFRASGRSFLGTSGQGNSMT